MTPSTPVLSVLMVSASFHPYVGGAEKQALELSAALRGRGLNVRVVTRRLPGLPAREELRGVPVVRLWCLGSGLPNALSFMASLLVFLWGQAPFYEAIHVHLAGSPALAASLAGRFLGKPVFVKLGGGRGIGELAASSRSLSGRLKLGLLAWLKPQFVAVARELAQEAAAYLGCVPLHILPNGVDTERYRPVALAEKEALRRRLGWPSGLGFLYVGRLSPEKRLPWFLEAWLEAAAKAGTAAFAAFIGEGSEKEYLKETARRGPLRDRVHFHPPMEDIHAAYAAADVFALPSVSEGLSNSLLEAMASGLAVLASRVGGTTEAVEEAKNGLLFAPEDAAELKRQLGKFFAHPELAARMGQAARQVALGRYGLAGVAQRYEALYRNAL